LTADDSQCSQLSTIFGPVLHYPSTDNFTIWDAKQLEVRPACRVEPSSAKDVAQILGVVVDNWCRFAVKGGGHSRHPDDSNSVGGVTIDLDKLNSIEPSVDGSSARVGGGASSGQVFRALAERNSSFVGGRVASVGIGGFTTGGGTSPFSNKYGWALDNVYEYEVRGPAHYHSATFSQCRPLVTCNTPYSGRPCERHNCQRVGE
jgi:FAD/FMN-containing dehydrogenase